MFKIMSPSHLRAWSAALVALGLVALATMPHAEAAVMAPDAMVLVSAAPAHGADPRVASKPPAAPSLHLAQLRIGGGGFSVGGGIGIGGRRSFGGRGAGRRFGREVYGRRGFRDQRRFGRRDAGRTSEPRRNSERRRRRIEKWVEERPTRRKTRRETSIVERPLRRKVRPEKWVSEHRTGPRLRPGAKIGARPGSKLVLGRKLIDRLRERRQRLEGHASRPGRPETGHGRPTGKPPGDSRPPRPPKRPGIVIWLPPIVLPPLIPVFPVDPDEGDEPLPPRQPPRVVDSGPERPPSPPSSGGAPPASRTPPPAATPPLQVAQVSPDEIWPNEIVAFIDTAAQPPNADVAVAQTFGLQRISTETNDLIGQRIVLYRIPDGRSVGDVAALLAADPRVGLAQPNFRYEATQQARRAEATSSPPIPTRASASVASGLQYALAKIRATEANGIARGRNVPVAVIDSGIDRAHPALAGAFARAADFAVGHGATIDAHGTAIAGVIRARGEVSGVAPDTELLAARAFFRESPAGKAVSSSYILLRAMDWSVTNGARVLNLSFAGPADPALAKAVAAAFARGAIIVAAAGNNGADAKPAYPAAYDGVIAVTATDPLDRLYPQANQGQYISVSAPGVSVLVLSPKGSVGYDQGTSIAAAHVSGIVALLLEVEPRLGPADVRRILMRHALDLGATGPDAQFGAGRVDAMATVSAVRAAVAGRSR